jgi:mannan endo-1,6-alpha-mannosidase
MLTSKDSIKSAASSIASGLVGYYTNNSTGRAIGTLPSPYYWWEAGAVFDTLIQYWHLTGDSQYNSIVTQGLLAQRGPNSDYMPPNQTSTEGNDDQSTWALAAMSAAEAQLPESQNVSWAGLAAAVFNEQVLRWDTSGCGGGLRWQIFQYETGYDYKNSASNGQFFQLASRLARYTGNSTYSNWASIAYNWTKTVGFIDEDWNVYDGAHLETNCTDINKIQLSYTAGSFITGAAHMYNITGGDAKWKDELDGLLNRTMYIFFPGGVADEVACEPKETCTIDMMAMKGITGHWLVDTIQMAPYTSDSITSLLRSSAEAGAKACDSTGCSVSWGETAVGGANFGGVGGQIDALSYVQGLLVKQATVAATGNTTSTGTSGSSTSSTATGAGTTPTKSIGAAVRLEMTGLVSVLGAAVLLIL